MRPPGTPVETFSPQEDEDGPIRDPLFSDPGYVKALELYDRAADDTDLLMRDRRSQEIAARLIAAAGSISASFEEGYGRATTPECIPRLRIENGEARDARGWYHRAKKFLPLPLIEPRSKEADEVIALLVSTIRGLKQRR